MDRKTIRYRFAAYVATLQAVAVWYSPSQQRIFARSLPCDEAAIHRAGLADDGAGRGAHVCP